MPQVLKQILHLKQMEKCVRKTNEHSFKIPNFTSKTNQKLRKTLNDTKFFSILKCVLGVPDHTGTLQKNMIYKKAQQAFTFPPTPPPPQQPGPTKRAFFCYPPLTYSSPIYSVTEKTAPHEIFFKLGGLGIICKP